MSRCNNWSVFILERSYSVGLYKSLKNIGIINKIKYCLSFQNLKNLYYTLIFPYLSYCNIVWGSNYKSSPKYLNALHKRIIRIICGLPWHVSTNLRDCCTGTHYSASGLRLRSLERTDLRVRRMRTHFGDRAFSAAGPPCWNSLPPAIRQWTHLKCSLKLTCSLRLTLFSCLWGAIAAVWPRYCGI